MNLSIKSLTSNLFGYIKKINFSANNLFLHRRLPGRTHLHRVHGVWESFRGILRKS